MNSILVPFIKIVFNWFKIVRVVHLAGFEPAESQWEADYESDAFGHLATDAYIKVGAGGTWTHVHIGFRI